jgi:hypothetical protein
MALIKNLTFGAFLGDKAFDNDGLRAELRARNGHSHSSTKSRHRSCDKEMCNGAT